MRPAELDEWVDGLEVLLDALGSPLGDETPPDHVWAGIAERIAMTPQAAPHR